MADTTAELDSGRDTGVGWRHMACAHDDGPAARAAIGLIVMANDQSSEPELRAFLPADGVALYASRIAIAVEASVEATLEMGRKIDSVAARIMPDDNLDVLAFGTTAGTMINSEDNVIERMRNGRPGCTYTTPITAALRALETLDARRIALLTPYPDDINAAVESYIAGRGLDISVKGSFKKAGDYEFIRITPKSIYDAAIELGGADVDAVFVSCTGLRVSSILGAVEAALGKPVISSNQALAWDCLRLAGYDEAVEGFGQLLRM